MRFLEELYEKFSARCSCILHSEKGQTLVEYGLLLVLIAIVLILMLKGTGQEINQTWSKINSGINP
jgi:Flp pilus assembly pilin Flp